MVEKITIEIDENSKTFLRKIIGKRVLKISYVHDKCFSLDTKIFFEDMAFSAKNVATPKEDGEEYPVLSFESYNQNKEFYKQEDFKFIEFNSVIKRIELITDKIMWKYHKQDYFLNIQNAIKIIMEEKEIVLYAIDTGAEAIDIFENSEDFEKKRNIEKLWPVETNEVVYSREYSMM